MTDVNITKVSNTVTVAEADNAVTVTAPGPKGDPGATGPTGPTGPPGPAGSQIIAAASTGYFDGGFFPGASQVANAPNNSNGTNARRLYFYWCPIQKELNVTGLFVDVQTAGTSGDLVRIGLFDYDLADLSTEYDTSFNFTLNHDFGTLPVDAVGEQAMDLSSSPIVIAPGLYAVGIASNYASTLPRLNGAKLGYYSDVPANLTTASSYVRSYSIPTSTTNFSTQVDNGFQTAAVTANVAGGNDFEQGLTTVFFRGYTTQ